MQRFKEERVYSLFINNNFCIIAITIVLTISAKFTKRKKLKHLRKMVKSVLKQIRKTLVGIFRGNDKSEN